MQIHCWIEKAWDGDQFLHSWAPCLTVVPHFQHLKKNTSVVFISKNNLKNANKTTF